MLTYQKFTGHRVFSLMSLGGLPCSHVKSANACKTLYSLSFVPNKNPRFRLGLGFQFSDSVNCYVSRRRASLAMDSVLVIKVKYGDSLRRFNARVDKNNQLDLDMVGLRAKICSIFSFSADANLILRYVDEDGDLVTLVDDDDLHDVMRQQLKFLKIDVHMNNGGGKSNAGSSGTTTPLKSPLVRIPFLDRDSVASYSLPEPLLEAFSKLSLPKAASSSPVVENRANSILKIGESVLNSHFHHRDVAGTSSKTGVPGKLTTSEAVPVAPAARVASAAPAAIIPAASVAPAATSVSPLSVYFPTIDFSEAAVPLLSNQESSTVDVPSSSQRIGGIDSLEESLLKELEEMGFKQVDLNIGILRMNEYDLEKSLDDLCGVGPYPCEELQEMGFRDKETNKRLLRKNNEPLDVFLDLLNRK